MQAERTEKDGGEEEREKGERGREEEWERRKRDRGGGGMAELDFMERAEKQSGVGFRVVRLDGGL